MTFGVTVPFCHDSLFFNSYQWLTSCYSMAGTWSSISLVILSSTLKFGALYIQNGWGELEVWVSDKLSCPSGRCNICEPVRHTILPALSWRNYAVYDEWRRKIYKHGKEMATVPMCRLGPKVTSVTQWTGTFSNAKLQVRKWVLSHAKWNNWFWNMEIMVWCSTQHYHWPETRSEPRKVNRNQEAMVLYEL